ncbi:hypothetical protein RFI_14580 [Reticulomyxa filosa]|uniref:HECT domain-containing protein n=1 Tax=Reticulomyxa filosa TaxID=46433 RepID=X6NA27_RETFI|nr:hypothetical protein RFI_14580 [Reticulomyxa filosa]|eukprot:ETO22614.1 hypothetical protein RFI_14580 [Reticulomyxa filosa]
MYDIFTLLIERVNMEFYDRDLGVFFRGAFPVRALHLPIERYQDPVEDLNVRTQEIIDQIQDEGLQPTDIKKEIPIFGIGSHYLEIEHALSIRKVRRSVLWLLRHWPEAMPFNMELFGGVDTVIRLLDLAAAEALSAGTSKSKLLVKRKNSLIKDFGLKEQSLASTLFTSLETRLSPDVFHKKWRLTKPTRKDLILSAQPCKTLTQGLVEECVLHYVQAVNDPNEVLMFESEHKPYKSDVDERRVVYVPGASRLMVTFDPQCNLANDFKTGLTFYADQNFEDQYLRCRGSGVDRFPTFIVPSNRFWYKFTSSFDNQYWGFRFYVKPIEKHIDDFQALDAFNFELGCWLFELLVEHQHVLEQQRYVIPLADALLQLKRTTTTTTTIYIYIYIYIFCTDSNTFQYFRENSFVIHLKSNAKTRGIEQLIKLLLCTYKLPAHRRPPMDLKKLGELGENMDEVVDKIIRRDRAVQSQFLNTIVELMAITELFRVQTPTLSVSKVDTKEKDLKSVVQLMFEHRDLYVWKIHIVSAKWGIMSESKVKDITSKLQEHVKCYGETRLIFETNDQSSLLNRSIIQIHFKKKKKKKHTHTHTVPPRSQWTSIFPTLFDNDPDVLRPITEKELHIEYEIRRNIYDPAIDGIRPDILKSRKIVIKSETPVYICAEQSTFDRVVEMSSLTLAVHQAMIDHENAAQHGAKESNNNNNNNNNKESKEVVPVETTRPQKGSRGEGYQLPPLFLGEVAKTIQVSESYYPVVSGSKPVRLSENDETVPGVPCPTGGVSEINEFSNTLQVHVITKANNRITLTHEAEELKTNTWYHVAVTGNAIGVKLFLGGKLVQKQRTNGALKHNHDPIYLGKCRPGVEIYLRSQWQSHCRYYLLCLSDKTINGYVSQAHVSTELMSTPKIVQLARDDSLAEPKLSLQYLRSATVRKVPEFDSTFWGTGAGANLDNEVMTMFETCYQETGVNDLRDVWRVITDANAVDANGNPVDNGSEREARNSLRQISQLDIVAHALYPTKSLLERHDALSEIETPILKRRYLMLQILNHKMKSIFPLVDFTQVGLNWSLAARLCSVRSLIFSDLKRLPWQNVLQQTSSGQRTGLVLNRPRALRARERISTNALNATEAAKKSIFGQAYRTLNFVKPVYLRCSANHRPWAVTYEGEGGTDAGGLFRDSLSAISADLQSDYLMLFIKCPNSRGYGDNQEKWIPNPSCNSSLHLSMYSFVGKLMGSAIRGRHYLNLDLPCVVWKPLVGKQVGREDLKEIDSLCFDILNKLSNIEKEGITPETFSEWDNRKEYVQLLEHYRLNEFNTQVEAIRRGLATIVPIALLPLFTWQELELMVCGKREIDLELLKANTVYKHGVKPGDSHVQFFWQVLEEFTHQQRSNFLRFVWGQSRLPTRSEDFHDPFGILTSQRNDDNTCFFTLELPKYSSKEIMKKKLLYAISNCYAIDTDFVAQNVNWDED